MVDTNDTAGETTGGQGFNPESNPVSKPQPNAAGSLADRLKEVMTSAAAKKIPASQASEPVILEEHVVEKTPQEVTAEDVGLKLPTPSPQTSASLKPQTFVVPPAPKKAPDPLEAPPEHVLPSSIALPPLPEPPPPPVAPVAAVTPPKPAVTAPPISPHAEQTAQSVNLGNDIQKILSQVKLPERRDFKAAADTKQPVAEQSPSKNLASIVTKPPTDLQEASAMLSTPNAPAISSVHTLKDDLQHVVKEKKMSLVRAVALEQDKKRDELVEEEFGRTERRKRVTGILFASFLFFGLGFAALFGVYLVMMSHSATGVESLNSLVFAEQSVALPLDNATPSELKRRIAAARQTQIGSLGSITRIVPLYQGTTQGAQPTQATTKQFFSAFGLNAPDDLVRSLDSTFFFGLHVVDKNAPVIVIPVTNYDRAFAAMLAWEGTMNADFSPAFTPVSSTKLDANGIPSERTFQDDVMRNYDVRELKDDSGNVELYYSFPSKNLLIIAESPYSFPELLSRLQSVRRL